MYKLKNFSFTYLRVNNSIKYFPRCDISQVLRIFSLGVWYLVDKFTSHK